MSILLFAGAFLIIFVVLIVLFLSSRDNIMDGPGMEYMSNQPEENPLTEVIYSDSGDSLGAHYSLKVVADGKHVLIEEEESPSHNIKIKTKKYKADKVLMDELYAIISKCEYSKWKDLPASEIEVFDASTASVSVIIDGSYYFVNEYTKFPSDEENIIVDIRNKIKEYTK